MANATHAQFKEAGVVSVFVGDFENEDTLDDYLDTGFTQNFGFEIDPADGPEADVEQDRLEIRSLIAQYSDGDQFCEAAGDSADALHIEEANTALIFYHFRYSSEFASTGEEAPVRFLGVFPFTETPVTEE